MHNNSISEFRLHGEAILVWEQVKQATPSTRRRRGFRHRQRIRISSFNLNMANENVSPEGVFLAGGGSFGFPGDYPMADDDEDGIWSITVQVPHGFTGHYTFTNGACEDWSCKENIVGQECADPTTGTIGSWSTSRPPSR